MEWKKKLTGLILFAVLVGSAPVGALAEQLLLQAPINPEFEQYLFEQEVVGLRMATPPEEHPLGRIPPPQPWLSGKEKDILSAGVALRKAAAAAYPTSFDLRTSGQVTAVRDQKNCGSCWAFGSYGSLESYIMPKSPEPDYSEKHLVWNHGFDPGPCAGGLELMTIAYLSRWSGPANESACPYGDPTTWTNCGTSKPVQKHIQNAEYFEYDLDKIKKYLTTGGAISSSFYMDNSFYNADKVAYYYDGSLAKSANHTVTIIGWDDDYPATNFSIVPPDNGAFLVKNSWGTAWGNKGYFWVSYYDTLFGTQNWVFHNAEATTNYARNYQYDRLGWINTRACNLGYATWGANIFTAKANEKLKAISFYTAHPNQSVRFSVYVNVTSGAPTSGTRKITKTITVPNVGYHTVKLPSAIALTKGKNFSVVLRYAASWSGLWANYVLPTEAKLTGYSSTVAAGSLKCFVSCDGKNWTDLGSNYGENNPIKAFTGS